MITPIFNSLGSNYNLNFILKSLLAPLSTKLQKEKARVEINKVFHAHFNLDEANIQYFYQGRDAIEHILRLNQINHKHAVLTQAFTCFALEEAIHRQKAKPLYYDIEVHPELGLQPDLKSITSLLNSPQDHKIKAIILQHSLGNPICANRMLEIRKLANKYHLVVIEDLAQAYGGYYLGSKKNSLLGQKSDGVVLSFGRDKILDAITGGVSIQKAKPKSTAELRKKVSNFSIFKKIIYPTLTWIIRITYPLLIGKICHAFFKHIKLIASAAKSDYHQKRQLPALFLPLIKDRLLKMGSNIQHRRKIAQIYYDNLHQNINQNQVKIITNQDIINASNCLKFNLMIKDKKKLPKILDQLQKQGIYLKDRWYRQAVDCSSLKCDSVYQKRSCPNAEYLANRIMNLPTHQKITPKKAIKISQAIVSYFR